MSKKRLFYIAFFVVLVFGFYFIIKAVIPEMAEKRINRVSFVRPFSFTNQDWKQVTMEDVKGKVYVAEFFFTTCPGICPVMNNNMRKVYDRYKDEKDFLILSHTSDPDTDIPPQLKHYSDSMGVNTQRWIFLTGRKDSLYRWARESYTIDDPKNNFTSIEDDFLHSQFWALVNKNGDVIRIYDGLKQDEVNKLISDISDELKKKYKPS
jgi:protein SCO1